MYYTQQQFAITLSFPSTNVKEFHFNWQQSTSVIRHLLLEWHTSRTVASENTLWAASDWFWAQQDHLRSEGCDRVQQTACSLHATPSSDTSSHVAENWTMSVQTDAVPSVFPAFPSHLQCKRHVRKAPADCSTAALTTLTAAPSSSAAAPDKLSATSLAAAVASHCQLSSTTTVPFHVVDYAMDSLRFAGDPRFQTQNMEHLWRDVQGGIPCFRRC